MGQVEEKVRKTETRIEGIQNRLDKVQKELEEANLVLRNQESKLEDTKKNIEEWAAEVSSEAGAMAQGSRGAAPAASPLDSADADCFSELLLEKLRHQLENCGDDRKAQVDLLRAVKCYNEQLQLVRDAAAKAKEEARAAAEARNTDPMEEDGLDEEQRNIRALAKASARVSPY